MSDKRADQLMVMPTDKNQEFARSFFQQIDQNRSRFVLRDEEAGQDIVLPEEIYMLLRNILIDLSQNKAVQICPTALELTTVQAAEYLMVSRPFLIKLLDQQKIPFRMVGTHRRIKLEDLLKYRLETDAEDKRAREELTKMSEELGLGY